MSFPDSGEDDEIDTAPIVQIVGVPAGDLPYCPTWAEYLILAGDSIRGRSRGVRGPGVAKPISRNFASNSTAFGVLKRLQLCTDLSGVEGSDLWLWFCSVYPRFGRTAMHNALLRLEAAGCIQSLPSELGGIRRRYRALSTTTKTGDSL